MQCAAGSANEGNQLGPAGRGPSGTITGDLLEVHGAHHERQASRGGHGISSPGRRGWVGSGERRSVQSAQAISVSSRNPVPPRKVRISARRHERPTARTVTIPTVIACTKTPASVLGSSRSTAHRAPSHHGVRARVATRQP